MFSRDWMFYAALGISIALGIFLGLAIADYSDPVPGRIPYGDAAAAKRDYEARRTSSTPDDALAWIAGVKRDRQEEVSKQPSTGASEAEKYHDALDLESQWAAASAAERMVRLTIWQIVFGGIGIAAVVWSLFYTHRAVTVGMRAAVAAEASIASAKENARRELRAYLFVRPKSVENFGSGKSPVIHMDYDNAGQTPAYRVRMTGNLMLMEHPIEGDFNLVPPTGEPHSIVNIYPGADMKTLARFHLNINKAEVEAVTTKDGKIRLYAIGVIYYDDIFETPCTTKFCFSCFPEDLALAIGKSGEVQIRIEYSACHNSAT